MTRLQDPNFDRVVETKRGYIAFSILAIHDRNGIKEGAIVVYKSQWGNVWRKTRTITYKKQEEITAIQAYRKIRTDTSKMINEIQKQLSYHAMHAEMDPENWGLVGDVNATYQELSTILDSLKYVTRED